MSFDSRDFLHHILAEVEYLSNASRGVDERRFLADQTFQRFESDRHATASSCASPEDSR